MELRGKRVLVTGAGHRVGAAIVLRLGARGADVAVHYHRAGQEAEHVCRTLRDQGRRAAAISADLANPEAPAELVAEAVAALGGLDLLVCSAASYESAPVETVSSADFDRSMALNVRAPFLLAQAARAELTNNRGSIVMITCVSPHAPYRNYSAYIASKGALSTLTRVLAVEYGPHVRVNAVAPGTVLPPVDLPSSTLTALAEAAPLKRLGSAEDIADAVVYLATASFVTGAELVVDGGRTISGA